MTILWLAPIAFAGLALAAIPIAIHFLVRQQSRRVAFPSLRFLRASRLAAVKRRSLQDLGLLVCRVSIVAAAVAALASPQFITAARRATYANRVARAIVIGPELVSRAVSGQFPDSSQVGGDGGPAVAAEQQNVYRAQVFSRAQVSDAVADASRWLAMQPPARRELVVVSPFARGFITQSDLAAVPTGIGVRLVQTPQAESSRDLEFPVLIRQSNALVVVNRRVHLDDRDTSLRDGQALPMTSRPIRVIAAAGDQALADAALAAVLDAGLRWPDPNRRITVVWPGADERAAAADSGATVVKMEVPSPISTAASRLERVLATAIAAPTDALEPFRLSRAELSAWERAPGPPPPDAAPDDEGDGRWLWGLALVLLALEHYMRRRPSSASTAANPFEEARVA